MAETETSSKRRSRSDPAGKRGSAKAAGSTRASGTSRLGSPHGSDGHPADGETPAVETIAGVGATEPGEVRIVSCHGGGTTKSSKVEDIAGLLKDPDRRLWIDLAMPSNDEIRIVADALGLHPLIAEDIADQNQRAKVETFDDGVVHVVLFALDYTGEASAGEIARRSVASSRFSMKRRWSVQSVASSITRSWSSSMSSPILSSTGK